MIPALVLSLFLLITGLLLWMQSVPNLLPYLYFYLGWRREKYFTYYGDWRGEIRLPMARFILGATMLLSGLGGVLMGAIMGIMLATLLTIAAFGLILFLPALLRLIPVRPRWVKELESQHSEDDIALLKLKGAALLKGRPRQFLQVINQAGNWEVWLTTVF